MNWRRKTSSGLWGPLRESPGPAPHSYPASHLGAHPMVHCPLQPHTGMPSSSLSFHSQLRSLETRCFLLRALPSPHCQSLSQANQSHILVISDPLPNVCGCRSCSCLTWTPPRPGQGMGSSLFSISAIPLPVLGQRGPARLSKAGAIILGWKHTCFRQITSSFEQWFSHLRVHYNHLQGWLNTAFSTFLLSPPHRPPLDFWFSESESSIICTIKFIVDNKFLGDAGEGTVLWFKERSYGPVMVLRLMASNVKMIVISYSCKCFTKCFLVTSFILSFQSPGKGLDWCCSISNHREVEWWPPADKWGPGVWAPASSLHTPVPPSTFSLDGICSVGLNLQELFIHWCRRWNKMFTSFQKGWLLH